VVLRIRAGDYRILYEVRDDRLVVLVISVGHRRDIYR
jgi:mRNA interferase RelE/StbE